MDPQKKKKKKKKKWGRSGPRTRIGHWSLGGGKKKLPVLQRFDEEGDVHAGISCSGSDAAGIYQHLLNGMQIGQL